MSELSQLKTYAGATHNSKALGRGRGSGKGGKSTRGGKGQTARKGAPIRRGFEGGQTPMHRRLPKVGFSNVNYETKYDIVNLGQLSKLKGEVGAEKLVEAGLVRKGALIKILGKGEAPKGLTVKAHKFTASAKAALEGAGGKAEVIS